MLILPYLDCGDLYDQYDFDQPWDSATNRRVLDQMPEVYKCRSCRGGGTYSHFFVVVGPSTLFPHAPTPDERKELLKKFNWPRGAETVIAVVESNHQTIHWTEPRDLAPADIDAVVADARNCDRTGHAVVMADLTDVHRGLKLAGSDSVMPLTAVGNNIDKSRLRSNIAPE